MEDGVASGHRGGQRGQIEVVPADEFEAGLLLRIGDEFLLASGEIVPADDLFTFRKKAVCEAAADESSGTGDENVLQSECSIGAEGLNQ